MWHAVCWVQALPDTRVAVRKFLSEGLEECGPAGGWGLLLGLADLGLLLENSMSEPDLTGRAFQGRWEVCGVALICVVRLRVSNLCGLGLILAGLATHA